MIFLNDFCDLANSIKTIAIKAVESNNPINVIFGQVTSISPLKIKIDDKIILQGRQLILCRNVTNYEMEMTVEHKTENKSGGVGDSSFSEHNHNYEGKKLFLVHNNLKEGEKVILLRMQGGQKFVVVDRLVS